MPIENILPSMQWTHINRQAKAYISGNGECSFKDQIIINIFKLIFSTWKFHWSPRSGHRRFSVKMAFLKKLQKSHKNMFWKVIKHMQCTLRMDDRQPANDYRKTKWPACTFAFKKVSARNLFVSTWPPYYHIDIINICVDVYWFFYKLDVSQP